MAFPGLGERVAEAKSRIAAAVARGGHGQRVTIVAVTKTHGADAVTEAWSAGVADVGENKVQEALGKMPEVAAAVRWHLIGHLQRNKVKALDSFSLFHALDSARLADSVDAFGRTRGRPVEVLLQVNVGREESKGGYDMAELDAEATRLASMTGVHVTGVMILARLGAGERELREIFGAARAARDVLLEAGHPATQLSMGMSSDYEIAVEEGATLVRLGTILFGVREQ